MQTTVSTIWGSYLQTCLLMRDNYQMQQYTTLNEKLNIQSRVAPTAGEYPILKYAAIGNGGHKLTVGSNGIATAGGNYHSPTDAALFNQLPFLMRPVNNDINVATQAKYRLKTIVSYNSVDYFAYYLKLLDVTSIVPALMLNTVNSGITTSSAYAPTNANLNPTPVANQSSSSINTTGNYISAAADLPFILTEDEISELINVSNIIYGSPDYAIISEMAICSGIDAVVSSIFNDSSQQHTEALAVQVHTFVNTAYFANYAAKGIDTTFNVGATQPLFQN